MAPRPEIEVGTGVESIKLKIFGNQDPGEDIVISGISGSFPESDGVRNYQENLMSKKDLTTDDTRRWNLNHPEVPRRGGKISNLEKFDASFFGFNSKQGTALDPQLRISLERTFEAIVDAGVNPYHLRNTKCGVFCGSCFSESERAFHYDKLTMQGMAITGCTRGVMAQRVSYWLGLTGPSCIVDTACSSSLMALERAIMNIRMGICDSAIVSGATLTLQPYVTLQFFRLGVLSVDGICKCFDNSANGYGRSEAIPVIFIQKAKDAKRVYAKIIHGKSNCDGFKEEGITFPGAKMQWQLLKEVYEECGVDPTTVNYIEAHGTGTRVGDPEECVVLTNIFCTGRKEPLLIGSVKSNMGHTEQSSGLCSIIKTIIALETGVIPPNLHYSTPREGIPGLVDGRLKVVTEPTPLPGPLAAVSSFGFGGANVHILLKRHDKEKICGGLPQDNIARLVGVSGRTEEAVNVFLDDVAKQSLDAEYVALMNELHSDFIHGYNYRGYSIISKHGVLSKYVYPVTTTPGYENHFTFVFPGLGTQSVGMGKSLMKLPPFAAAIEQCQEALHTKDIDLFEILTDETLCDDALNSIMGVVATQIAIVDCFSSVGLYPQSVLGYSIGELACAYAVKDITLAQAIQIAYHVGKFFLDRDLNNYITIQADIRCSEIMWMKSSDIKVVSVNANQSVTLVGPKKDIQILQAQLLAFGKQSKEVDTMGVGLHASVVDRYQRDIEEIIRQILPYPRPRTDRWITTSEIAAKESPLCDAVYFTTVFRSPVDLISAANEINPESVIVDIGPDSLLKPFLERDGQEYLISCAKPSEDFSVQFLNTLGRIYTMGHRLLINNLYPAVEFPVSRGTPMIGPLVRWNHDANWFVSKFADANTADCGEVTTIINMKADTFSFLAGHTIDGRILFPAMGYVKLVADFMADISGRIVEEAVVTFENVQFRRATHLTLQGETNLKISIHKLSGRFEITDVDTVVVEGYVFCEPTQTPERSLTDLSFMENIEETNDEKTVLNKQDIYKELRLRGYHYSGLFRGLKSAYSTSYGQSGKIDWNRNFVTFMDTMLQLQILDNKSRSLYVPTSIDRIVIDNTTHASVLQSFEGDTVAEVKYYRDLNLIKAGGIEIWSLRAQIINRKKPLGDPVLEKYSFVEHFDSTHSKKLKDLVSAIRFFVHLALENCSSSKVKVIELFEESTIEDYAPIAQLVVDTLFDLPLIQADVRLYSGGNNPEIPVLEDKIQIEDKSIVGETQCTVIVAKNLLSRPKLVEDAVTALKDNGFLISRERRDVQPQLDDFVIVADKVVGEERFILLRKKTVETVMTVIPVESDLLWLNRLKKLLTSGDRTKIILVAENDENSGILGLTNCLQKETGGNRISCVFICDKGTPKFDINLPLYRDQLAKDLAINVFKNGSWGSYRHQILPNNDKVIADEAFLNNSVRGDISTLQLFQAQSPSKTQEQRINVHYASVNFRDVMVATGRIAGSNDNEHIGFEYSGINEKGERVMGIISGGAMSSSIMSYPSDLQWKVPEEWSLEDAATIPIVYATAHRAINVEGKATKGESILIHSAAGGVGIAAINISLGIGLEVYVTVGTEEKREFVAKNYPQILASRIFCSRDTNFEDHIKSATGNRGVDMVLNSLAEDKFEASLRCVAEGGRFLEIGKYDLQNNHGFATEPLLRHASIHAVMLDVAMADPEYHHMFRDDMQCILDSGFVKPLPRTCFNIENAEQAFRYMMSGKHIGKVLLKLPTAPDRQFIATPRHYCSTETTHIIIGGLGGFGLELTDWLVSRGAKKVVIVSRNNVKTGYQASRIKLWREQGVLLSIVNHDVSSEEGVTKLLTEAERIGPVESIYNLAVVLRDALFENQTEENFLISLAGKAKATQLLDTMSRHICPNLQTFVVFSSISCGRGNAGQTNYGMSNSIMERICEKRVADGLPGLAIQWGAVGDVGLVADMAEVNKTVVIGGTLQQSITSCLQCMDTFLRQREPIVASMVVAEKKASHGAGSTIVETVRAILGIRDLKTIPYHTSLSELGMDSLMAVEIKQTVEREFETFLTAQDLRSMTFAKLNELDVISASGTTMIGTSDTNVGLNTFLKHIPPEEIAKSEYVELPGPKEGLPTIFVPGMDGHTAVFENVSKKLQSRSISLVYPYDRLDDVSITKTAEILLPTVLNFLEDKRIFRIIGYSGGILVSLELAHMLENQGMKGHVISLDGSPSFFRHLSKMFNLGDNDEDLENAIISSCMDMLHPGCAIEEKEKLTELKTWEEKMRLLGTKLTIKHSDYSMNYLSCLVRDATRRVKNILNYAWDHPKQLSSKITLVKPQEPISPTYNSSDYHLSELTEHKIDVHTIAGDHLTMLNNEDLPILLNKLFEIDEV